MNNTKYDADFQTITELNFTFFVKFEMKKEELQTLMATLDKLKA